MSFTYNFLQNSYYFKMKIIFRNIQIIIDIENIFQSHQFERQSKSSQKNNSRIDFFSKNLLPIDSCPEVTLPYIPIHVLFLFVITVHRWPIFLHPSLQSYQAWDSQHGCPSGYGNFYFLSIFCGCFGNFFYLYSF